MTADGGVLGAVLAGGESSRFGAPKALALVGGRSLAARAGDALRQVVERVVLIANHPEVARLQPDSIADEVPGLGPLAGIVTALRRAEALGLHGALCVACDMPFVPPALLRAILDAAAEHPGSIVVPESEGRRGCEPLCACYPLGALSAAEAALAAGERAPHRLLDHFPAYRLPLAEVRRYGDPAVLFFNLNTMEDLERAERIASGPA